MKMKSYVLPVFLAAVFLITSCNNPLNKKYSEASIETDIKDIVLSKRIDSVDAGYMATYIMRAKMLGEKLEDKTYSDILKNAKELRIQQEKEEAEQKILAVTAAREEKIKSERFNKVLAVALYDKGYLEGDYENYLTYGIAFQNKSNKTIRAFKGQLKILDLFDAEIKTINLTIDEEISPNSTMKDSYTTDYNQFLDEDTRLKSKELKDLKGVWICEKILFTDGTSVE